MELTINKALLQAIDAHKEGKLQDAELLYKTILKSQPQHPDANHNLGLIAVSVKKIDVALPLFKTALEANPKIEQFWLSYIDALIKDRQINEAKKFIEQAKQQGVVGKKLNILETRLSSTKELKDPSGISPSQQQIDNLLELYQAGKYDDAEKLVSPLTKKFPKHSLSWKVLGAALKQTGKINEALIPMQKSVQLSPQDAEAHNNLGITLKELGKLDEALVSYRKAIILKTDHAEAYSNLGNTLKELGKLGEAEINYKKAIKLKPGYTEAYINLGVVLKEQGRLNEAEASYRKVITLKPNYAEVHSNLGITLQELGRLDEAEKSYKQAIKLKPDYAEAHNNFGVMLQVLSRLDEAEASLKQAIRLKPNYAEAYSNLGVIFQKLGRLDKAEASLRQAIKLKLNYAEAYNNLANVFQEMGKLEEAMNSYTKAIELDPQLSESRENLLSLLTSYVPHKEVLHPIFKVDQKIKKVYAKEKISGIISDDKIIELFSKSSKIIKEHDLKLETNLTQVYRRNSIELNCKRHKTIFDKFNIIPKFCFGCYKVQVEPKSIIELIKLFVLFDQIKFTENNSRKCMIEMRPEISGFYKGLIYCSNLEEAYQIANYLEIVVKENIRSELYVVVKRGCSEYPISFPDYKAINKSGAQLMNYNEDWKSIEKDHDSLSSIKLTKIITPSLSGLNLQDILIIRNWIDYAKGIGDSSVHLLNQNMVFSPTIYEVAKSRIEKYPS